MEDLTAPGEPRFLVDLNVGRLAKWLRVLGYDARFAPNLDDGGLVEEARREGRVLLTRDRRLLHRRAVASGEVKALLLESEDPWDQLRQVVQALALHHPRLFSRCLVCNTPLAPAEPREVQDLVPPYVLRRHRRFLRCPSCGRAYWPGTHWRNMQAELARLLREAL